MGNTIYRLAGLLAAATGVLQIWMNVAVGILGSEENPANMGFFMIVATAGACAFTARFRPEGMARGMVATAGLQALLGVAVATAPVNAAESTGVLALSAGFTGLWLMAAALFYRSARGEADTATA